VAVVHGKGTALLLDIRGHVIPLDQPVSEGGCDTGPSPTELFVGAIAGCVGHYVASYMRRHGLTGPLKVTASYEMSTRPARISSVAIRVEAPGIPSDEQARVLAVARHCTLHNTLMAGLNVSVSLDPPSGLQPVAC